MDTDHLRQTLGISTVLPKPFSIAELLRIVDEATAPAV